MPVFRSETMKHGTLVVPSERARNVLHELGKQTSIQFEDMNSQTLMRAYKASVQRIEECERIVRFLQEQIDTHLDGTDEEVKRNPQEFLESQPEYRFEEVEAVLKQSYQQLQNARENHRSIGELHTKTLEEKYVVHVTVTQLTYEQMQEPSSRGLLASPDDFADMTGAAAGPAFSNIAGVIGQHDQERFSRALFRMSRGNTFTSFHPIAEPIADLSTGKPTRKSVFVVYFQGRSTSIMADKVRSICSAFGGNLYPWQPTIAAAEQRFRELNEQLKDSKVSQDAFYRFLDAEIDNLLIPARQGSPGVQVNSVIEDWRMFLMIEKSIYSTLNLFEGTEHTLKCDCWYPENDEDMIRRVLMDEGGRADGVSAMLLGEQAVMHADPHEPARNPPTHVKGNEFTGFVQTIVDTYGTPRYKEANPMLLTLVTFPFIFGVMFGDVGHGLLLFLTGCILCLRGKKLVQENPMGYGRVMFESRYIITMMGFFSIYAGLMYNDFLSTGLDLFGSRYTCPHEAKEGSKTVECVPQYDTTNTGAGVGPYPFGLDPAWHGAQNELLFVNSMKMKIAVLLGVAQMVAGILLSFSNGIYDRSKIDIFCVCVPQMIFMIMFFGYMDYLIVYKWTHEGSAPSIINAMICMGLMQPLPTELFAGQAAFQSANLALLGLCVPWMLIPKPLLLYQQHKSQYQRLDSGEAHHFDFAEICIHQIIETIEFVLGSISHTASYLRLWALSLAHQQLSLVFFQKTIMTAMVMGGAMGRAVGIFCAMAVFLCITVGVLMGMDFLECFLHTLRLHWVEFQSKFFKGDGHIFQPYSHARVIERHMSA